MFRFLMCELIIKKPKKKPNKYAPLSPIIKTFKLFKIKIKSSTEIIR